MSVKQRLKNWRTKQALAREERKAEREEEKLYMREKIREAKEERRLKKLHAKGEAKKQEIINKPSVTERLGQAFSGFGGSSSTKTKGRKKSGGSFLEGFEMNSNFDLGVDGIGLEIAGSRKFKGRKKKDTFEWF